MAITEKLLQSVLSDEATTRTIYPKSTVHLLQELLLTSSEEANTLQVVQNWPRHFEIILF